MTTTTDKKMAGYTEAQHDKALTRMAADAMSAAEVVDWRKGCVVESCEASGGRFQVVSPNRGYWLYEGEWMGEGHPGTFGKFFIVGEYANKEEAENALASCTLPYPGYIPPVDEARKATDIGDGLGLDHDQPRRTLAATMAKMPELADSGTANIGKDGEAPTADDLIATLSALPVDGEYACFWGQSVAAALSFVNDDNSIEVAFVGEGTKPRVCFRRLRNKAMRENLTPRPYHVMLSVMVEVDAEDKSDAWNNARDAVRRVGGKHIEVIDALNVAEA